MGRRDEGWAAFALLPVWHDKGFARGETLTFAQERAIVTLAAARS